MSTGSAVSAEFCGECVDDSAHPRCDDLCTFAAWIWVGPPDTGAWQNTPDIYCPSGGTGNTGTSGSQLRNLDVLCIEP